MLALSTVLAHRQQVPTLVFDEVDAGIGGHDIVDIIILALIHARYADADFFAQWTANGAFDIDRVKAAIRNFAIAACDIAWFYAIELDDTGGGVAAK